MGVLTELRIAHPVPLVLNALSLTDQSQQVFWGGAQASDETMTGDVTLALRVLVLAITSTIQALPGQLVLMCSGASLTLSCQRVWRPWRFSISDAVKGFASQHLV